MNFPLRTFVVGARANGDRMLHVAGCHLVGRYKTRPTYWWTDAHGLSLHTWLEGINICAGCLPKKEIEDEFLPITHIQRLEPLLRQRRIEAVLA